MAEMDISPEMQERKTRLLMRTPGYLAVHRALVARLKAAGIAEGDHEAILADPEGYRLAYQIGLWAEWAQAKVQGKPAVLPGTAKGLTPGEVRQRKRRRKRKAQKGK